MFWVLCVGGYIMVAAGVFFVVSYFDITEEIDEQGNLKIESSEEDLVSVAIGSLFWLPILALAVALLAVGLAGSPFWGGYLLGKRLRNKKIERLKTKHRLRLLVRPPVEEE